MYKINSQESSTSYQRKGKKITDVVNNIEKLQRFTSLPANVGGIVKECIFDQYFKFGSTIIELDRVN